jgi:hypothetical protein
MRTSAIAVVGSLSLALALVACGGGHAPELCDTIEPTPAECMAACDPRPDVPPTCPTGYHCTADGYCDFQCTVSGNECGEGNRCTDDGRCVPEDSCEGLECEQVECPNGGTTSLSGTVFAPNGTLPLYNVNVYVPRVLVAPFGPELTCDQCGDELSGRPLVQTLTDTAGNFVLTDVPATDNVPVVIQVGRWRRQITIERVTECVDTPLANADTRLPRNQSEGDLPRMALTTGGADGLECLLRKIGIDDAEFTAAGGSGRVHLYAGSGGTDKFDSAHGGADFANATTLWDDTASLSSYDITFLSCEGGQNPDTKPGSSLAAMKSYADVGGRVFASHWHNYWLEAGPAPWPQTITRVDLNDLGNITANVNTGFERGSSLAQWLVNVNASPTLGQIAIKAAQHTVSAVNASLADRWIYQDTTPNGQPSVQYMAFTTPVEAPREGRCGRVVFSDIHVSGEDPGDDHSNPDLEFPSGGCTSNIDQLSPQEKVLAFMIFDIASCIPDVID